MTDTEKPVRPVNWLATGAVIAVAVAAFAIGLFFLIHPGEVRTSDAQIDGHILPVNSRVAGTITWVNPEVEDTRLIPAGTLLLRLDSNDYQPTVDRLAGDVQASAALENAAQLNVPIQSASAISKLAAAQSAVSEAEAEVASLVQTEKAAEAAIAQAEANYSRAEADRKRYEVLVSTHEISRSEYDQRLTDAKTTQALLSSATFNRETAKQRVESARARVAQKLADLRSAELAPDVIATARANVKRAAGDLQRSKATLTDAELNLSYTQVKAPVDGVVGRKSIEIGQRISPGQLMLTLVPPNDVWVIANFRETQLRHMQVGQSATIHVDTFGRDLQGVVESIGGATGSKYSVIAPDNATGNFVKVVQRVPVRLRLRSQDAPGLLLPGMSCEVSVKLSH